jgi:UDP-N-acetylglucosamine 2-epimerase (non-hydrolysing)
MSKHKIVVVFGTRPEAIKLAPVIKKLRSRPKEFDVVVVVTAQHREMLDQVLETFDINPDYDLNIMRADQSLSQVTSRALSGLAVVYQDVKPSVVIVQGDTTTAFVGALAAYYLKIKIAHVEAGLRTWDKFHPFPEEINRRLVSVVADYNFAPTTLSRENLLREGVKKEHVFVTGNTVIDALLEITGRPHDFNDPYLASLRPGGRVVLVTIHRRESFGRPMEEMCCAIAEIARSAEDLDIVIPVHPNPTVRATVRGILEDAPNVHLIKPLDYQEFAHLLKRSHLVLTDSGGIQEEAPALGKPVLVLRETTERPEAITAGTAKLVGVTRHHIVQEARCLLEDESAYAAMANAVNPYGDGHAAERIAAILADQIQGW